MESRGEGRARGCFGQGDCGGGGGGVMVRLHASDYCKSIQSCSQ